MRKVNYFLVWFIGAVLMVSNVAGAQGVSDPALEATLREFLLKPELDDDPTTRYTAAPIDLDGNGEDEQVVYLTGNRWCGSGGCTTLVVRREGDSWQVVSRIRVTEAPVRVLENRSGGWRSLAVPVTGAGPKPTYVAELPFDGASYPENPTSSEARPLDEPPDGEILLPAPEPGQGRLLYAQ